MNGLFSSVILPIVWPIDNLMAVVASVFIRFFMKYSELCHPYHSGVVIGSFLSDYANLMRHILHCILFDFLSPCVVKQNL